MNPPRISVLKRGDDRFFFPNVQKFIPFEAVGTSKYILKKW